MTITNNILKHITTEADRAISGMTVLNFYKQHLGYDVDALLMPAEEIEEVINSEILGRRGVVIGVRDAGMVGHVFNVAKRQEGVIFFDGQRTSTVDPQAFLKLYLVPTS